MTITIGWLRRRNQTVELVLASDSRLRSRGAMDQAQKLFQLQRGDCVLAFCGDAQVAYPFFIQVGTALDNHLKTQTRAADVTRLSGMMGLLLNNLVGAWDLSKREKMEELKDTRIMFGGWSWENKRFDLGFFQYESRGFTFHHRKAKIPHPWYERERSLVFIGDYEEDYMGAMRSILECRYPKPASRNKKVWVDFNYEPLEALHRLLQERSHKSDLIGGAPQMVKTYCYGNTLPFVTRTESGHYLLGRRLFDWEKTEYPVLNLTGDSATVLYPKQSVPVPAELQAPQNEPSAEDNSGLSLADEM